MAILTGVATIVGLLTKATPIVGLVKSLIQGAEDTVGGGNGQRKKNMVIDAIRPYIKNLKDSGKWPDEIDDNDVSQIVELIFGMMVGGKELKEQKKDADVPDVTAVGEFDTGVAYPVHIQLNGPGLLRYTKVAPGKV